MALVILGASFIAVFLWIAITSAIVAYRYRERMLALLATSALLLAIVQSISLTNLLVGEFSSQGETWRIVQLAIFLLAIAGLVTFNFAGGLPRLHRKGLSLKRILLLRIP